MYGLYGLKHHIVEITGDVTDAGRTTSKDRATQLLICEPLSFAIISSHDKLWGLARRVFTLFSYKFSGMDAINIQKTRK